KKITKEMILNKAKELSIKFIRLRFTDILGMPKNVEIPVRELEKALNGEIMFDGSSIQGFVRIEESDMFLKPDYSTFTVNLNLINLILNSLALFKIISLVIFF
ncbi:unnamed protein product, partial [marine sediment metagenome]